MAYTNAQFRSILNGHTFSNFPDPSFPISNNGAPLTDRATVNAVKAFQTYYKLTVDGIVGSITMAKAEQAMRVLQANLNRAVNASLPPNQPFYGPRTVEAVKEFERRYGYNVDGIANLVVRQRLNDLARLAA